MSTEVVVDSIVNVLLVMISLIEMMYCRIIPFWSSGCGGSQESDIDLDVMPAIVIFSGAALGAVKISNNNVYPIL